MHPYELTVPTLPPDVIGPDATAIAVSATSRDHLLDTIDQVFRAQGYDPLTAVEYLRFTCPQGDAGVVFRRDQVPYEDTRCLCPDPRHWLIKYTGTAAPTTPQPVDPATITITGGECPVCGAPCQYGVLMCGQHWRLTPHQHKTLVSIAWRRFNRGTATVEDLRRAQRQAVAAVLDGLSGAATPPPQRT